MLPFFQSNKFSVISNVYTLYAQNTNLLIFPGRSASTKSAGTFLAKRKRGEALIEEYFYRYKKVLIVVLIMMILSWLVLFFIGGKPPQRENIPLTLKEISINGTRKNISAPLEKPMNTYQKNPEQKIDLDLKSYETTNLEELLDVKMNKIDSMTSNELESVLNIVEELILRDADNFKARKAKLVILLVKENKFQEKIDDYDFNSILEDMASFNLTTDVVSRREAALISISNYDREELLGLEQELGEELWVMLNTDPPVSEEIMQLKLNELKRVGAALDHMDEKLSANIDNNLNSPIEDLVEISFWRNLSRGDFEGVISDSSELVDRFPHSLTGYFFLIRSLELSGRSSEVYRVLEESALTPVEHQFLQARLEESSWEKPTDFWKKIRY